MAWSEDAAGMGFTKDDEDRSPDLSDELNHNQKLKSVDLEGQGRRQSHHHVTTVDDTSSTSESVGRQIELESENQIKYRTCSWEKVRDLDSVTKLAPWALADSLETTRQDSRTSVENPDDLIDTDSSSIRTV